MYNEEKGAEKCVDTFMKVFSKMKSTVGFIVVDAASTDKTNDVLRHKKKIYKNRLVVVNLKKNTGYGGALRAGTKESERLGYKYVLFMDSDLTNNPKDISRFVAKASDKVDCVKATRYSNGGSMLGVPLYRQAISILANNFARLCFRVSVTDCTNGFRMVRISSLNDIQLKEEGFSVIVEELYELKKKGATFDNVPVILTSRKDTKTHFSYSLSTLLKYTKYTIKAALIL